MGLVVNTDDKGLMIFKDEKGQYPRYYYAISRKNDKGEYVNAYQTIKFKKGVSLENNTKISIKNAFFSFDIGKDDKKYPYLMVTDFQEIRDTDFINVPDGLEDAVPFT